MDLQILVFLLGGYRYALPISCIRTVVRAVEITPLPKGPEIVLGLFNLRGDIVPVVDLRARFALPKRELSPDDRFIIAWTGTRHVALHVEALETVLAVLPEKVHAPVPGTAHLAGIAALDDGIVLIADLAGFLSLEEERQIDKALEDQG